jgi:hypothetical protein
MSSDFLDTSVVRSINLDAVRAGEQPDVSVNFKNAAFMQGSMGALSIKFEKGWMILEDESFYEGVHDGTRIRVKPPVAQVVRPINFVVEERDFTEAGGDLWSVVVQIDPYRQPVAFSRIGQRYERFLLNSEVVAFDSNVCDLIMDKKVVETSLPDSRIRLLEKPQDGKKPLILKPFIKFYASLDVLPQLGRCLEKCRKMNGDEPPLASASIEVETLKYQLVS